MSVCECVCLSMCVCVCECVGVSEGISECPIKILSIPNNNKVVHPKNKIPGRRTINTYKYRNPCLPEKSLKTILTFKSGGKDNSENSSTSLSSSDIVTPTSTS